MDRLSLQTPRGVFTSLVFTLFLQSCRGQPQLLGPSKSIAARIGDDITLPCYLKPPTMDVTAKTLEWTRADLDPVFVFVWRAGREFEKPKLPFYRGRTSLFTDELRHGNMSLKLSNVNLSDKGTYRCYIVEMDEEFFTELVVASDVASPAVLTLERISIEKREVTLKCESAGWYPEPELLWLDGEGNLLPAAPAETLRGPDGLYAVSSRVTVEKKHSNKFTCRVQQKNINQSRETHIHVPDDFFISPSGPPSDPNIITGLVIAVVAAAAVVLLLLLAVFFVLWKRRRDKCRKKKKSEEDEAEQTRKEKMIDSKNDNCGFHVVEEGESDPLMAGRQGEDDVDNRGEQRNKEERETQQDEFVLETEQTKENPQEKRINPSAVTDNETLITIEKETQEDVTGGEGGEDDVDNRGEKRHEDGRETADHHVTEAELEGGLRRSEETMNQFILTEKESQSAASHVNTDQEPGREKEKQQEQLVEQRQRDVMRKKRSEGNRNEEFISQKTRREHQREKQLEEHGEGNQRKKESERRGREKDETEVQRRKNKKQHDKEEKREERSEEECEHEEHGEGNQRESLGMTERKREEQRGEEESRKSSVSSKVTLNTHLKIQDRRGENQEKQAEETSEESREGTREQPEEQRRVKREEDQGEMMDVDEGVPSEGTNRKEREKLQLRHEGALQQQMNIKQKSEEGAQREMIEEPQEEPMDDTPDVHLKNIKRKKPVQEIKLHEVCKVPVKKKKTEE